MNTVFRRKWIVAFIVACSVLVHASHSNASDVSPTNRNIHFYKVMDLPLMEDFKIDAQYFDLGVCYEQIAFSAIPIWNYNIYYCGITADGERFVHFFDRSAGERKEPDWIATDKEIRRRLKEAKVQFPDDPSLPFWESYGGKLTFGFLSYYLIWVVIERLWIKPKPIRENKSNTDNAKLEELRKKIDELKKELDDVRSREAKAISQRDTLSSELSALKQQGGGNDRKFSKAKKAFARLYHPDSIKGDGFEKIIRVEIFKEYWKELEEIEKSI